jgi:hypothetical protein
LPIKCVFKEVVLAFDADDPGEEATAKMAPILAALGAKVRRLTPEGARLEQDAGEARCRGTTRLAVPKAVGVASQQEMLLIDRRWNVRRAIHTMIMPLTLLALTCPTAPPSSRLWVLLSGLP